VDLRQRHVRRRIKQRKHSRDNADRDFADKLIADARRKQVAARAVPGEARRAPPHHDRGLRTKSTKKPATVFLKWPGNTSGWPVSEGRSELRYKRRVSGRATPTGEAMPETRILLVEDDPDLAGIVTETEFERATR
jgi:hypothetical protein